MALSRGITFILLARIAEPIRNKFEFIHPIFTGRPFQMTTRWILSTVRTYQMILKETIDKCLKYRDILTNFDSMLVFLEITFRWMSDYNSSFCILSWTKCLFKLTTNYSILGHLIWNTWVRAVTTSRIAIKGSFTSGIRRAW